MSFLQLASSPRSFGPRQDSSSNHRSSEVSSSSSSSDQSGSSSGASCDKEELQRLKRRARTEKARAQALQNRIRRKLTKENPELLEDTHPAEEYRPFLKPQSKLTEHGYKGLERRRRLRLLWSWFSAFISHIIAFLEKFRFGSLFASEGRVKRHLTYLQTYHISNHIISLIISYLYLLVLFYLIFGQLSDMMILWYYDLCLLNHIIPTTSFFKEIFYEPFHIITSFFSIISSDI